MPCIHKIQSVDATPAFSTERICSSNTSAEAFHPCVLRGLLLRLKAMT